MAVVEKYRVDKRFKWLGQWYDRGDAISRTTILSETQVGEARLGSLQRNGFISLADHLLSDMKMDALRDHARDLGLSGSLPRRKDDLIDAIEGAV